MNFSSDFVLSKLLKGPQFFNLEKTTNNGILKKKSQKAKKKKKKKENKDPPKRRDETKRNQASNHRKINWQMRYEFWVKFKGRSLLISLLKNNLRFFKQT